MSTQNTQILDDLVALITQAVDQVKAEYAKQSVPVPDLTSAEPHPLDAAQPPLAIRQALQVIEGASTQLSAIIASPSHTMIMRGFTMLEPACIRVAVQAKLADKLTGHSQGVHVSTLAKQTGIEEGKLSRVLRQLAVKHIFQEISPNTFANNRLSALLVDGNGMYSLMGHFTDEILKSSCELYDTLIDPTFGPSYAPHHSPFNRTFKCPYPFFQFMNDDRPDMGQRFGNGMIGWGRGIGSGELLGGFPWKDLPKGTRVNDVGGGVGATSIQLAKAFPNLSFVIQDLPGTIEQAETLWAKDVPEVMSAQRAELKPIDFLKEVPVKDCEFYFLKNIMHDWPDEECKTILSLVAKAMKPNSRVLIQEYILQYASPAEPGSKQPQAPKPMLPNYGAGRLRQYNLDLDMMIMLNSKERTLDEFIDLGKAAGLSFVKFWDLGENGLVELKLA